MPSTIKRISPMLAVADLAETLQFYTEVLQFHITLQYPEYAIVERDGATVHFMPAADASVLAAVRGHAEFYIEVDDIHALWSHVSTFKGRYKIRPLRCFKWVGAKAG